jgi:3-methyladenine DNA glycosylase AlkC
MEDDIEGDGMDGRGIRGWAILPLTQYVGEFGLDDFDLGMDVQKELTKRFTSEFGIRDFIAHDMDRALKTMTAWVDDPNVHVRRLVSEGTRPRLPWASTLPDFIENPEPVIPLLTILRDDVDEYVRRSVANHLNDIAKDHPDRVAGIAKEWMVKATPKREKLVRHALRTLIKNGHPGALSALGYGKPVLTLSAFDIQAPRVEFGNALNFSMCLMSDSRSDQDLIVDYIIHHKKANGKTSPKVFKWKNIVLKAGKDHKATRNHRIKAISTRKYYPGVHHLEIVVNGVCLGRLDFELMM